MKTRKLDSITKSDSIEYVEVYPEIFSSTIQKIKSDVSRSIEIDVEYYLQIRKEIDELLCMILWNQLQSLGLITGKNLKIADLKTKLGIHDLYSRWFDETLAVLTQNNFLTDNGASFSVFDSFDNNIDDVWKHWDFKKGIWASYSNLNAQISLVETTLKALPEIITGKKPVTEILFKKSSMELIEGIYKNNPIADYYNEVLADKVLVHLQERLRQDPDVRIRILEIGAGTGGTSAMVFLKLKPYQTYIKEYCYTDISNAFLTYGESVYGPDAPYLTYPGWPLENPPPMAGSKSPSDSMANLS